MVNIKKIPKQWSFELLMPTVQLYKKAKIKNQLFMLHQTDVCVRIEKIPSIQSRK